MRGKLLGRSAVKALKRVVLMHDRHRFPGRRSLMDGQSIVGHIGGNLNASHTGPGPRRTLAVAEEVGGHQVAI